MDKKRLLLLGGGHAEIPLIKAAQALGYYVITTGNAREGLGHPYADKNVFEDFSNKDAMLELARREHVDAVCSGCNDFALLSTVYVCEKLGLPGHDSYETSLQIHHKDKYRALAERLDIPTPRAVSVRNRAEFDALFGTQGIASPSARNDIQTMQNDVQCHSGEQDDPLRHSGEFDVLFDSQGIASPSARNDIQPMRNGSLRHSGEQDDPLRHCGEFDVLFDSQGIASPSARNDIQTMQNDVQCHSGEQDDPLRHSGEFDALFGSQGIASPSARNDIQPMQNDVQCHSGEQDDPLRHSGEFDALFGSQGIASPSARNDIQPMQNDVQCHSGEQDDPLRHSGEQDGSLRHCEELCDDAISLTFPVIVKPVDLTGGKGIHRAANYEEAAKAYEDAVSRTREDHVVVEEFVTGTNHGFSAMLVKGKVAFYFADNEQYFVNKYMVSGASTPSTTSNRGLQLLYEYSERIATELNLVDGILHIQYIERDDGIPVIIEICRRPPGDLYIRFVQYATGVNYPRAIILAETGKLQINDLTPAGAVPALNASAVPALNAGAVPALNAGALPALNAGALPALNAGAVPALNAGALPAAGAAETFDASAKSMPRVKPFLRHCVMANREGIVQGVTFANEIADNVVEKFMWFKKGEPTGDILYYKAGIVFLQFDSVQEMLKKTARMTDLIRVALDDDSLNRADSSTV